MGHALGCAEPRGARRAYTRSSPTPGRRSLGPASPAGRLPQSDGLAYRYLGSVDRTRVYLFDGTSPRGGMESNDISIADCLIISFRLGFFFLLCNRCSMEKAKK